MSGAANGAGDDGLTIDELGARAGMTARNVRAHISRGLVHPGVLRGRTAYYDHTHVARLDLISALQRRGFSLAAIDVLIDRTPSNSAEDALRLYRGMLVPWQPEEPVEIDADGLAGWLGIDLAPEALAELRTSAHVTDVGSSRIRITNPALTRAGAQAMALGVPPTAVTAVDGPLTALTREIADLFLALFRDHVWRAHVEAGLPRDGVADVRTAVEGLQPVAVQALLGAFRPSMQAAMDAFVRELSETLTRTREAAARKRSGQG